MEQTINRDSNAELLRIVSMLMILVHHVVVHGLFPGFESGDMSVGLSTCVAMLLNGLFYVGASSFVLISGYYGIRFKWRELLNLYLIVVFYTALWQIGKPIIQGTSLSIEALEITLLPFSHRSLWFIQGYFILYLLSPILNAAVEHLEKRKYVLVLGLLTVLNVYLGFWWGKYNYNGYNYAQMVYLYMIAGYLRRYVNIGTIDRYRWKWLGLYIAGALLWTMFTIGKLYIDMPHWKIMSYNNPFTILSSIGFFLFMMSFHFQSKSVNWIAKSCFAMYLLQNKTVFESMDMLLHKYVLLNGSLLQWVTTWGLILVFAIVFMVVAVGIDRIRMMITNPVLKLYDKINGKLQITKYE